MRWVDFFYGAGGASTGILRAGHDVVVAVNHDPQAIKAHSKNHKGTLHLNEDVRQVDPFMLKAMKLDAAWWSAECTHLSAAKGGTSRDADSRMLSEQLVYYASVCRWPVIMVENVKEFLTWGPLVPKALTPSRTSLRKIERRYCRVQIELMEATCTHNVDAQARLCGEMDKLIADLDAYDNYKRDTDGELIMVPDPEFKGSMYLKWRRHLEELGYSYDSRLLMAADFGVPQTRLRYFAVLIRKDSGYTFDWPHATHSRNGSVADLFTQSLKKWVPAREILNLDEKGLSIFSPEMKRGQALSDATLKRIRTGLWRYGREAVNVAMVDRVHTGSVPTSVDSPLPTIMASMERQVVSVQMVDHHNFSAPANSIDDPLATVMAAREQYLTSAFITPTSFNREAVSLEEPLPTILAARKHHCLCSARFLAKDYSSSGNPGGQIGSLDAPIGTIMTKDHHNLVQAQLLCKYHGNGDNVLGLHQPLSTATTKDRLSLATAFIAYPHHGHNEDRRHSSLDEPVKTIATAYNPSLVQMVKAQSDRLMAPNDWPYTLRLATDAEKAGTSPIPAWCHVRHHYVVDNRISEIHYRGLLVEELMRGQTFPDGYFLGVAATTAKYMIGNAVPCRMAEVLAASIKVSSTIKQRAA